jgi:hypothetical protein
VAKKDPALTEREMVERLRPRYEGESGNGPAGCLIAQVRNQAGFDASRTIDALGFHFWPSRGLLIDAFECKSSRSDWLRELENPAKAETFCRLVDRFYVVAGRADLVKVDEVPPDWGLIVPRGGKMTEVKPARVMHAGSPAVVEWVRHAGGGRRSAGPRPLPPGFDRSFLVAIVRQAFKLTNVTPEEIAAARKQGFEEGQQHATKRSASYKDLYDEMYRDVRAFEEAAGLSIHGYRFNGQDPKAVGAAVKAALAGDLEIERLEKRVKRVASDAAQIQEHAEKLIEQWSQTTALRAA